MSNSSIYKHYRRSRDRQGWLCAHTRNRKRTRSSHEDCRLNNMADFIRIRHLQSSGYCALQKSRVAFHRPIKTKRFFVSFVPITVLHTVVPIGQSNAGGELWNATQEAP